MKRLAPALLLCLAACATIGPEHEQLSRKVEGGIAQNEVGYNKLLERVREDGMAYIDLAMRTIHGPNIMKYAIALEDKKGLTFDQKYCEKEGELDRAVEMLKFVMAASRKYQAKKDGKAKLVEEFVQELRVGAQEKFLLLRQASGRLTNGLKAYNKDKKWRKEWAKKLNFPVDQIDAANKAASELRKRIEQE